MNFDRLAPFYRAMEMIAAGGKLQRCRLELLDEIPPPTHVLLAGEGHGRFLPECVSRFPEAEIVVVDSSGRMLEIAAARVNSPRVRFVHADLLEWTPAPDSFDLVVTNFFLDCFPADTLAAVVSRLGNAATADAHWLLADFQIAEGRIPAIRSRAILSLLYTFFRLVTGLKARSLHPPDRELEKAGFIRHRLITHDWGLLKSEWWRRDCERASGRLIQSSSSLP